MRKSGFGRLADTVLLLFAMALLPMVASAQDEEDAAPGWTHVRVVALNTSGSDKWIELQQQLAEVSRADEDAHRDVWQEVRGDLDTYHIVSFPENLAEFDEQGEGGPAMGDDQEAWLAAIVPTISSRTQTLLRQHANLTIPSEDDAEPNLLVLRYIELAPGRGDDFHEWAENQLRPALVEGGATGIFFGHVAFGGNVDTCVIAVNVKDWAELDGPGAFAHLSEEEVDALFASWGDMVVGHEVRILSYRADLSY